LTRSTCTYLHSPNATDVPFEDQVATLAELRDEGVIRRVGLSNVSAEQFQAAQEIVDIAAVTALYNISDRTGSRLLAAAERAGVAFSPWHPTTVIPPAGDPAGFAATVNRICAAHEATVPQLAIAWLLHRSPFMLPIPGTSSRDHFEENLLGATINLTAGEADALTELVSEEA
jgi:aryl-alcohol dehydrogenase-like predicted oxidoreductase